MNILISFDKNYCLPVKTMLESLFLNNSDIVFTIYAFCEGVSDTEIEWLVRKCKKYNAKFIPVEMSKEVFSDAPSTRYYSKTMYYRLLAAELLPETVHRVLYIDPDTLILNPIRDIYYTKLENYFFVAASHNQEKGLSEYVNKIRLNNYESNGYFNSGVLLMNLDLMREEMKVADIYDYIEKNKQKLLLPDQDVLNGLYGHRILPVEDSIWNYDTRKFEYYLFFSQGVKDMDWIMENTVILHFCGKQKPWNKGYMGYFSALYKHYQRLSLRESK